jgi:type VI secretion system protein ImpA
MVTAFPIDVAALLRPISADQPCGEDLSFDPLFDAVRQARLEDDPTLPMGTWERELKKADWPGVRTLCLEALDRRSKDLSLACYLTEALGRTDGFRGVECGLRVLAGLVRVFWNSVHPLVADDVLETLTLRQGRLEALNSPGTKSGHLKVIETLRSLPLVRGEEGAFGWSKWDEAQRTENLGKRDVDAMRALMDQGAIGMDIWTRAAETTPAAFVQQRHDELDALADAYRALVAAIEEKCAEEAARHPNLDIAGSTPNLRELGIAIDDLRTLMAKVAKPGAGAAAPAQSPASVIRSTMGEGSAATGMTSVSPASTLSGAEARSLHATMAVATEPAMSFAAGGPAGRADAIRQMIVIADFFNRTEPHSPVPYLLRRAARWAAMPLEEWLNEVLKEDAQAASRLRELLDVGDTVADPDSAP